MFNYSELLKTGKFYIEFNNALNHENLVSTEVEDLVRYWYRQWFDKLTNPSINWVNLYTHTVNDVLEVFVDLTNCKSSAYVAKDFLCATEHVVGDNRRSLYRTLTYGVNNSKTKLPKVNCDFVITNNYNYKLVKDIPNPYTVKDFTVNTLNTKAVNISNILNDLFIKIEQDKDVLDKVLKEDNYLSKYSISRNQLDRLEQLELAVNALTKYLELD